MDYDLNNKGKIKDSVDNVELMLKQRIRDWKFQLNQMTGQLEFECLPEFELSNIQDLHIQFIDKTLRREYDTVGTIQKSHLRDACWSVGLEHSYDPIRDYVTSVSDQPRDPEVLETWLINLFQLEDTPYHRAVSRLTMLGAAKRMLYPGCQFDTMLVIESLTEGFNKSSLFRCLAPFTEWFTDSVNFRLSSKKLIEETENIVIVEIAEMNNIRDATIEHIKVFIARREDSSRLAYGHYSEKRPRKFIFIGTTNDAHYLQNDQNRRFWPVRANRRLSDQELKEFTQKTKPVLWNEAFRYVQEHRESTNIKLDASMWPVAAKEQSKRIEMPRPEWQELLPILSNCYILFNDDLNQLFFPNATDMDTWRPFQPEFKFRSQALKLCRYSPSREKHPIFDKIKACWTRYEKPEGWTWEGQQQLISEYVEAHSETEKSNEEQDLI